MQIIANTRVKYIKIENAEETFNMIVNRNKRNNYINIVVKIFKFII
jgi:hypothetical protein